MYKTIYVPVDNSDHSNRAIDCALALGQTFSSKLVGCHVYAASMHDYRFKQMEYTLPEEYLEETELERQRRIHDSLITMGLQLISESYLEPMRQRCQDRGLEFEPRMMDGKHRVEIVRDLLAHEYDLTVIGAFGLGRVRDSQIGSVCEEVARSSHRDVWVVKRLPERPRKNGNGNGNGKGHHELVDDGRDTILVGIDGSPQSFGALETAIELARRFGKKVETISVYDPYLHYSVFKGVVDVLTERAAKIFRFEEQNQLHEEIIDTGLAQIYQSHLDVAEKIAGEHGVETRKTLLDGKAFQKVLDHVRKTDPWLLVVGRIGVHSPKDTPGLGSNAENLLRSVPCDVLLTTRLVYPELDVKAEESIRWTPEAEQRFQRVPDMVKGIARTAIYRLAVEQGHSVISSDVLDDAMARYMPKRSAEQTERLAEALAFEAARARPTFLCKRCGVVAQQPDPKRCAVCGGDTFEQVTAEMLDQIAQLEGGLEVDTTYDGKKLQWTQDAKRALKTIPDMYQRRRAKARIEKKARVSKLPTVTLELARQVVEEETGKALELPPVEADDAADSFAVDEGAAGAEGQRLVARDSENVPLLSSFAWSADAVARVLRVPAGLMRDRTQERVETLARERRVAQIDLSVVEEGIALGRKMMEEFLQRYESDAAAQTAVAAPMPEPTKDAGAPSVSKCPFHAMATGQAGGESVRKAAGVYLNEVGLMSDLAEKKRDARERGGEN
jgi:nucleotide-binding universal stress UspA family protein